MLLCLIWVNGPWARPCSRQAGSQMLGPGPWSIHPYQVTNVPVHVNPAHTPKLTQGVLTEKMCLSDSDPSHDISYIYISTIFDVRMMLKNSCYLNPLYGQMDPCQNQLW